MADEKPSILSGVDVFAILGVDVREDVDAAEARRSLRRIFLKRAKECHPDKQKDAKQSSDTNLEFARLKAAFDYLQNEEVFNTLYNRVLHQIRSDRARKERSKGIAAKQSQHLEELLKREQQAASATAREQESYYKPYPDKPSYKEYQVDASDVYEGYAEATAQKAGFQGRGILIVAARTMKIANESEINCLLLSDHFKKVFANFGVISVDPIDVFPANADEVNVKVGMITFESHEHALKALLYYRNNRNKFRRDLYALALGPQGTATKEKHSGSQEGSTLEDMESVILKRMRQAAMKKRKTVC